MKTKYAVILCVLLLLVSACAQKVNDPADVQVIKKTVDDYVKAVNAGDAGAVAATMTDKTVYSLKNVPVAVGAEAIQSLSQTVFSKFQREFSAMVEDVRVFGDLAVTRGTWTQKMTPRAQGMAAASDSGTWIAVFARQNDGSWKHNWVVSNSNQPLPGSTASGEDEQALYQIERDWAPALAKKDVAVLERKLANDFQANYATFVGNKKQLLSAVKNDTAKIESIVPSEMKAIVFGDQAIVQGVDTEKTVIAGKDSSGQYRWTDLFVKREGRWQCVAGYSIKVQ